MIWDPRKWELDDARAQRRLEQLVAETSQRCLGVVWEAWLNHDGTMQRVDFVTEQVEEMLGHTPEEWHRTPNYWLKLVHPQDSERAEREALAILLSCNGGTSRFRWVGRSGKVVWVESIAVVVRSDPDAPPAMRGVTIEITERLEAQDRLRHELSFNQAIMGSVGECICAFDGDGRIAFVNPAGERLLGRSSAELIGMAPEDLLGGPRGATAADNPLLQAIRSGATIQGHEDVVVSAHGASVPVECSVAPITSDGNMTGIVVTLQDIADRKRAEDLRRLRESLTQALAGGASLGDGAAHVLQLICEHLGWDLGTLWLLDRSENELRCEASWARPDAGLEEFDEWSQGLVLGPGEGLPGQVVQEKKPVWVRDLTLTRYPRADAAHRAGLRSAVACPLLLGDEPVGVLELFSRSLRSLDQGLLDLMATAGSQLAVLSERKRVEEQTQLRNQELQSLLQIISHDLREPLRGIAGCWGARRVSRGCSTTSSSCRGPARSVPAARSSKAPPSCETRCFGWSIA